MKNGKSNTFIFSVLIFILLAGVFSYNYIFQSDISNRYDYKSVRIADLNIETDIANTPELRTLGLSGRERLENDSGMLFVFEKPDFYGFWMKDMNFPIDIIWISENLNVVYIEKDVQPETFPKVFKPEGLSLYVLEINAGLSDLNNIKISSKVFFE